MSPDYRGGDVVVTACAVVGTGGGPASPIVAGRPAVADARGGAISTCTSGEPGEPRSGAAVSCSSQLHPDSLAHEPRSGATNTPETGNL